jgi:hypothetical protein
VKATWLRGIIRGLSLTSALFIFQACYGTPQDFGYDLHIDGNVKARSTGLPIKGIKVSIADNIQYEITDDSGEFSIYTERTDNVKIMFEDIDNDQNGLFQNFDTILTNVPTYVSLAVRMEEK